MLELAITIAASAAQLLTGVETAPEEEERAVQRRWMRAQAILDRLKRISVAPHVRTPGPVESSTRITFPRPNKEDIRCNIMVLGKRKRMSVGERVGLPVGSGQTRSHPRQSLGVLSPMKRSRMLRFTPSKYVVRVYITSRLSSKSDRSNNYTEPADNTVESHLNRALITKDNDFRDQEGTSQTLICSSRTITFSC
ncbi:hypothetical protein BJV74DRAFT_798555 [Russula compacta]|nr:hypothetical protein BJV74DRAFT_798555 [Russula compacta]